MDMPDIPPALDRRNTKPLVWSFTFLHTYLHVCPHQAAQRYIYKTVPFIETEAMRWGNEVHTAFEHRVGGGKPLPATMQHWEPFAAPLDNRGARTEVKLGITREGKSCEFFDAGVWGRGKLDVVLIQDTTAYIPDWKTGGSKYESPFELEIQALLLHARYPHLKVIRGNFVWLKENRMGEVYDLSNTAHTWKFVNEAMAEIEKDRASGQFAKRQGPLCGFCPVFGCEYNKNPEKP